MEDENHGSKNISALSEGPRYTRERNRHQEMNDSRKNMIKSIGRKYPER